MKVIDFEKKGNIIRFYLGDDGNYTYWGDDWNDAPYEHNAGEVYDENITGFMDVYCGIDYSVLEPADNWQANGNSEWTKEDMKREKVPCIVIIKGDYEDNFPEALADKSSFKIYFNMEITSLAASLYELGNIMVGEVNSWQ